MPMAQSRSMWRCHVPLEPDDDEYLVVLYALKKGCVQIPRNTRIFFFIPFLVTMKIGVLSGGYL